MSQDRPPSPIQPRVVTDSAYDTAQVQRQAISGASYLGRTEPRHFQFTPFQLPDRRYPRETHYQHRYAPTPLHLPPIRSASARYDTGNVDRPLAFADILSAAPSRQQPGEKLWRSRTQNVPWPVNSSYARQTEHRRESNHDRQEPGTRVWQPPHRAYTPYVPPRSHLTFQQAPETTPIRPRTFSSHQELENYANSPSNTAASFAPSQYSGSSEQSPSVNGSSLHFPATEPISSQPPPLNYHLSIRQQPIAARACGYGERDRRVIDPPPILELKITDKATGAPEQDPTAMLALHCTLLSTEGNEDNTSTDTTLTDVPSARRLMGTLVASPYQAKDEHGVAGTFFVFSDLSCRIAGTYKLEFRMLRVDPLFMHPGAKHGCVASIETSIFTVYAAKDFPGMRASSALLMALRGQGLTVGLKKGTEARISKGKKRHPSDSSSDDDGSESENEEQDNGKPDQSTSDDITSPSSKTRTRTRNKHKK